MYYKCETQGIILCNMRVLVAVVIAVSVTATLSCPPGFVPQGNSCVCADWPNGMVVCDENSLTASMQIGYCMTYDNETGEIRVGRCANTFYRNDSTKFYYPLPSNASDLNDQVCGPSNSKGLLCAECQDGFGFLPLSTGSCINCTSESHGWIKFLTSTFLPSTMIFIIILTFSISVVSGPINSFLYFGQVTTTIFSSIDLIVSVLEAQGASTFSRRKSTGVLAVFYGISNMNTPAAMHAVCLTSHLSRMEALALQYVTAFYPLLIVVLLYGCIELHDRNFRPIVWCWKPFLKCFLKFRRSVDPKTSVIDAFATFILLFYMKLLVVTGSTLMTENLYNGQAEKVGTVAYFSANLQYFHVKHLPFALLSIFLTLTFIAIPPIVLIFYPTSFCQKCLTRCKVNSQALRTFVETFHGCYKDGTNGTRDCRYFAGLYFILRIIPIILIFLASHQVFANLSALLYLLTALLCTLVNPYKKHMYNVIDAVIFGILGIIYFLFIWNIEYILFAGHSSTPLLVLIDVLYSLPLLYLVLFIVYWVLDRKTNCTQKFKGHKLLQCFFPSESQREDFDDTIPHRLLNPEQYEPVADGSHQEPLREQSSNTYGTI